MVTKTTNRLSHLPPNPLALTNAVGASALVGGGGARGQGQQANRQGRSAVRRHHGRQLGQSLHVGEGRSACVNGRSKRRQRKERIGSGVIHPGFNFAGLRRRPTAPAATAGRQLTATVTGARALLQTPVLAPCCTQLASSAPKRAAMAPVGSSARGEGRARGLARGIGALR